MNEIQVSIKATEIKAINYQNEFTSVPGKQLQLKISTNTKIRLNMSTPLSAIVDVTFHAEDEEKNVILEIETFTPITVSSFVDNLDKVLQNEFLSNIMLAVNERIRSVTSMVGINLRTPNLLFTYSTDEN